MVKKVSDGYRSFTVVNVSKHGACKTKGDGGRYISKTPAGAASKAFNEFCRVKDIKGICTLTVTMKETTVGSAGKSFSYKLQRRKLQDPIIRLEGTNNEFVIEYKSTIKSTNKPTNCTDEGQSRGRMKKRTSRKNRKSANNVRRMRSRRNRQN